MVLGLLSVARVISAFEPSSESGTETSFVSPKEETVLEKEKKKDKQKQSLKCCSSRYKSQHHERVEEVSTFN